MLKSLMKLWKDEEGATAVEYGLIVAAIAGVIIVVMILLGNKVNNTLGNVASQDALRFRSRTRPRRWGSVPSSPTFFRLRCPYRSPILFPWAWVSSGLPFCDLRRRRIPNAVTGLVFVSGLLVRWWDGGVDGRLSASLSGLAAAVLVILALYRPWSAGRGRRRRREARRRHRCVGGAREAGLVRARRPPPAAASSRSSVTCWPARRRGPRCGPTSRWPSCTATSLRSPAQRPGHVSVPYALAIAAGAAVAFFVA